MKQPANGGSSGAAALNSGEGGENVKIINPELWQACAGPLVNLPSAGTHVVYFPQGHSEQRTPDHRLYTSTPMLSFAAQKTKKPKTFDLL